MARSSRAKSDASQPRSPTTRKSLQLSPKQSTKLDDYREGHLRSPTSPTTRRAPRRDLLGGPLPSTPEEWIEFAQTRLRRAAASPDMSETILDLAEIEPDLLEFLITTDEEIRDTIFEALCKIPFPTTREAWRESIFSSLLERFRVFFNRLPPKLVDRKVDDEGRQFTYLTTALDALDHLGFSDPSELEQGVEQSDPFFKVKSTSQKKRKASISIANRARRNTAAVDPRVFKAVDVEFPNTLNEAMNIQSNLLLRLQEVLEVFLVSFANPELSEHAKALFLKEPIESIIEILPVKQVPTTIVETPADTMTTAPDSGDFPHIRPLAAAKYFDEGPTLGAWPIVVAGRAIADFRRMRKRDNHAFDLVHKKITELSEGQFSEQNQKRLVGIGTDVPIYEAKVSRDAKVVYQIDLETDVNAKIDRQIIKIYGVYTDAQLDNQMWSQISYHLDRRGKGYLQRCLYRSIYRPQGQTVTLPAQFNHQDDAVDAKKLVELPPYKAQGQSNANDDELNLHSLLTNTERHGHKSSLPTIVGVFVKLFRVMLMFIPGSAKEKEIIYHDSACCVLGRSGTGKTTCIVFKMLGIEIMFDSMKEFAKPRQVFVTQSRVLAQRVQEYYQKLVKSSFDTLLEPQPGGNEEPVLADLEDEDASAFGLPPKYSMLEDHHFPLFLSFDQLCSLLEADFGISFGQTIGAKASVPASFGINNANPTSKHEEEVMEVDPNMFSPSDFMPEAQEDERIKKAKQAIVTFDKFLVAYWPRFDERRRKGLDPALVYSEFLGVIEGSEAALRTKSGALSREEYTSGNHKRASFVAQRDYIYDLYEAYRKRRGQLWNYDVAERTHTLVKATNAGVPGKRFDCLYIDEAQDNLLIDIKLLHNLSNNPHGLFMAGDTAQTISAGSSFRFEDLKAFMWRLEEQDEAVRRRKRDAIHPALFHLAINYRSHAGIVDCASSVVELISDLFPESIDKLDKETGLLGGPAPVFFSGWERGVVRFEQFLRGGSNIQIDFGASQAILVRNDAARTTLREQMGEIGLILTLYESKGLEFDDVLLYNFFEDSLPSASTWRIVLAGIETAPNFDELRHSVICAELKHLYVGLTRARKHCWIWDVSDKAQPMKAFWTHHKLVSHCGPGDPIPQLGVSSSKDAWAERGRSLFNKQLYSQAAFCFDKAGLTVERDIAAAYESRKQARLLQAAASTNQAAQTFLSTATAFMECAKRSIKKQQFTCYMRAAECFMECGAWKSAAEAFLCTGQFDLAAKNYRRAGCFDEAVNVVKTHRDQMEEAVAEEVIEVAKLEYLRTDNFEQAEKLFENVEEQLEYMGDYGFNVAQIHVLETEQRYEEAAAVAFGEHNIMEGLRLLLLSDNPEHRRQAVKRALHSLWTLLPFGPQGNKLGNAKIVPLIQHLERVKGILDDDEIRQLEVFEAIRGQDSAQLTALAQSNGVEKRQPEAHFSPTLASILSLLCFSYSSDVLIPATNWTISDFINRGKTSFGYFAQLLQLGRNLDISSQNTQKLLGFEPREPIVVHGAEDTGTTAVDFWVHSTSQLFNSAQNTPGTHDSIQSDIGTSLLAISEVDTSRLVKNLVYDALRFEMRKIALNNAVDYSAYLDPCVEYAVFGICDRGVCQKQHVDSHKLSDEHRQKQLNSRAHALIVQLEMIHAYPPKDVTDSRVVRRTWSRQAYELLMPYFPPLGGLLCLDQTRASENGQGLRPLSVWCEDALHYIDPKYGATILSDILMYLDLASRIEGSSTNFTAYAYRLHSNRLVNWRQDFMWRSPVYPHPQHSIVHDLIDFYARRTDTALARMVQAMHHVVMGQLAIEANVLVQALEFIGREVIVHYRLCTYGPQAEGKALLDRMLIPRSWAVDLLTRPRLLPQRPFTLHQFTDTLYKTIELLHTHELGLPRALMRFGGPLNLITRTVLIMRICRILILFAVNTNLPIPEREIMRYQVWRLLNGPGNLHASLCARFARTNTWIDFQEALAWSQLNRGADELVFLWLRSDFTSSQPPSLQNIRTISYSNVFPELAQALSLNGTTRQSGSQLNPRAEAFVPSAAVRAASNKPSSGSYSNMFTVPVSSQDDPLVSAPDVEPQRVLTAKEILMGKKILHCYREYAARQKVKARMAGRIIWKYYRRHRLRHLAPQTATGDMIRKLHVDYMRDVERLAYPPLLSKCFYRHKRVLLGCMPHVIIYLRGLEDVNRHELATKKKELVAANHKHLEKIQSRINACSNFAKKINVLIQDLSPGSSLLNHLDSLQQRVRRAADARQSITQALDKDAISAGLEDHYVPGVEAILVPKAAPAATQPKDPRPELNTSDLVTA